MPYHDDHQSQTHLLPSTLISDQVSRTRADYPISIVLRIHEPWSFPSRTRIASNTKKTSEDFDGADSRRRPMRIMKMRMPSSVSDREPDIRERGFDWFERPRPRNVWPDDTHSFRTINNGLASSSGSDNVGVGSGEQGNTGNCWERTTWTTRNGSDFRTDTNDAISRNNVLPSDLLIHVTIHGKTLWSCSSYWPRQITARIDWLVETDPPTSMNNNDKSDVFVWFLARIFVKNFQKQKQGKQILSTFQGLKEASCQ